MPKRFLTLTFATMFLAAACGGTGESGAPSTGGTGGSGAPIESENAFDPASISGSVTLGQWESSPAEGTALKAALDAFATKYPNIKVTQTTIPGDYRAAMVTKFGASDVPDLFYINAEYAPEWPNITEKQDGPADGKEHDGETGKFAKFFSAEPGQ